jgi:hypothetical protein
MTKASFELQFMLNTRLATLDKYPIRLGDLMVMDLDGKALPETCIWSNQPDMRLQDLVCVGLGADRFYHRPIFQNGWVSKTESWRCVLAIDPAGRGKDELAWAVLAELNGNLFLLESGGSTLGYADEVLQYLSEIAKKWDVNYVVAESNMGDGMFSALLKPHLTRTHPCTIEEVRHNIRKEERLCDTLGPLIQQHRLIVNSRVIKNDYRLTDEDPEHGYSRSLFWQASRLTQERNCLSHDDRLDALAIAVGFFVESAAQDQQVQQQHRKDQLFQDELEAWMDETTGSIDSIAFGFKKKTTSGRAFGGVQRLKVGS